MASLEWYRSFSYVYRTGTMSAAARGLHLTQPAISQHIAALEAALGYSLFVRTPRRLIPTDDAKALYTQVAEAIERLESLATPADLAGTSVTIRLGAPHEFFAARVIDRLDRDVHVAYVVSLGTPTALLELLREGQLDAVISTIKIARPELVYRGIFEETFWLVGPPDLRPPSGRPLESWLRGQPWIAYGPELPIIRRFWRQVFNGRPDIRPKLTVPDLRAVCHAVERGLGVSVLPEYLCADAVRAGRLTLLLRPKTPVTNELWLAFARTKQTDRRVRAFLDRWVQ
jgi:DNA-binding transcriptional LysR family regulator